jgi:hypothetical protein
MAKFCNLSLMPSSIAKPEFRNLVTVPMACSIAFIFMLLRLEEWL